MADIRTSPSRRAASNSGTRLPSTRERRPALAALAVLLIVGGAFASGFLALQAGNRADYLRVSSEVPQGAEITEEQLETVSLPEDMEGAISVDDRDAVVGLRAVTHLLPGTILTDDMVTEDAAIQEGMESVSFGLDVSNVDPDLDEGAALSVYAIPEDDGPADSYDATLISIDYPEDGSDLGGDSGTSTVQVKVLMDDKHAAAIQSAIVDDRVSITEIAPPPPVTSEDDGGE